MSLWSSIRVAFTCPKAPLYTGAESRSGRILRTPFHNTDPSLPGFGLSHPLYVKTLDSGNSARTSGEAKERHLVRYTQEPKQEAMLVQGIPDYKVAVQYGVSRAILYNWMQRLLGRDKVVPMKKKADSVEQSR